MARMARTPGKRSPRSSNRMGSIRPAVSTREPGTSSGKPPPSRRSPSMRSPSRTSKDRSQRRFRETWRRWPASIISPIPAQSSCWARGSTSIPSCSSCSIRASISIRPELRSGCPTSANATDPVAWPRSRSTNRRATSARSTRMANSSRSIRLRSAARKSRRRAADSRSAGSPTTPPTITIPNSSSRACIPGASSRSRPARTIPWAWSGSISPRTATASTARRIRSGSARPTRTAASG
jgi:hypothetical protein